MFFPSDWPEDCPPSNSTVPCGWFYRVVENNPPTHNDFISHAESGKALDAEPCLRHGLSVFSDFEEAKKALKVLRHFVRRRKIAIGYLGNLNDRILYTPTGNYPRSHHTWWVAMETVRENGFAVHEY